MAVYVKQVFTIPMVSTTGCDLPGDRTVDIRVEPYSVLRIGSTDTGSIFPVRLADLAEVVRRLTGGPTPAATPAPTPEPVGRLVLANCGARDALYVDGRFFVAEPPYRYIFDRVGTHTLEWWRVERLGDREWPATLDALKRVEEVGT